MPIKINNVALWFVLVLSCILFIPFVLMVERDDFFEVLNLLICAFSCGTAVAIHPAAWESMKLPVHELKAGQVLAVAVTIICIALTGVFAGQYWWRYTGKMSTVSDSWELAFTRWVLVVAIILAYLAAGAQRGEVPVSTYQRAGAIVSLTILAGGLLITFGYA